MIVTLSPTSFGRFRIGSRGCQWLGTVGLLIGVTGCHVDELAVARLAENPATVYWAVQLNHHAATLSTIAPWDTMQLAVTALTSTNESLTIDGAILTYTSADSSLVSVTSGGHIQAKKITSRTAIVARLTIGNLTAVDTLFVKVVNNANPKKLARFSIQPGPEDSAKTAVGTSYSLAQLLKRTATDNTEMTELLINYRSLNQKVVNPDRLSGSFFINSQSLVGPVTIVASTYAYGVGYTDTLHFRVGYPLTADVQFGTRLKVDSLRLETFVTGGRPTTVGVGATINFFNLIAENDVDLFFDDTTGIQVPNPVVPDESVSRILKQFILPNIIDGTISANRRFTIAGTYTFRDRISGVTGSIQVIKE